MLLLDTRARPLQDVLGQSNSCLASWAQEATRNRKMNTGTPSVLLLNGTDWVFAVAVAFFVSVVIRRLITTATRRTSVQPCTASREPSGMQQSISKSSASDTAGGPMSAHPHLPAFLNNVKDIDQFFASCPFMAALQAKGKNKPNLEDDNRRINDDLEDDDKSNRLSPKSAGAAVSKADLTTDSGPEEEAPHIDCDSVKSYASLPAQLKKGWFDEHLKSLSQTEREKEREAQKEQLAKIFALMQTQPDRFGSISIKDMEDQMSNFYM
ncbi:unnamed protein product [Calicophoron daubneyi]|uniref:Matrix-remodeling-associated protein 7 helical domain-containing protein n=1 Tax=Calicophoron daubneyi TaxID=300641 RepID=A0AAV2TUI1_CALDB